jgi:two-component system OmpR family response regulator
MPFDEGEFLARVRVLCRRSPIEPRSPTIKVGCLTMDLEKFTVCRGVRRIDLHRKEFDILKYLMIHKDCVISKDTLLNRVWSYECDTSPNAVEVHICNLREKMNRGFKSNLIKTVRAFGYKLKG